MSIPETNLHVTIIGTGAMACLLGARLGPVAKVTLTGSWIEGIAAIQESGIRVEGAAEHAAVPVAAAPWGFAVEPADLVLVLVKAWQTQEAARRLPSVPGSCRPKSFEGNARISNPRS